MRAFALVTLIAAVPVAAADAPPPLRLEAAPADAGLRIHVHKRGLFAAFAHDHDFEVTRWQATVEASGGAPARATLALAAAADSLRDREHGLSDEDRHKVDAQAAGAAVLDATAFPEITYRAEDLLIPEPGAEADAAPLRGTLHGQLTLRGRTRPVDARFEARRDGEGWRVDGSARFRQSDFGIAPFTGAGGTVGVKDEIDVTFSLTLRPAAAAPASP